MFYPVCTIIVHYTWWINWWLVKSDIMSGTCRDNRQLFQLSIAIVIINTRLYLHCCSFTRQDPAVNISASKLSNCRISKNLGIGKLYWFISRQYHKYLTLKLPGISKIFRRESLGSSSPRWEASEHHRGPHEDCCSRVCTASSEPGVKEIRTYDSDRMEADMVSLLCISDPNRIRRCLSFFVLIIIFGLANSWVKSTGVSIITSLYNFLAWGWSSVTLW